MDHHKGLSISATEGFEDSYYYGCRPSPVYIPRFKNVHDVSPGFARLSLCRRGLSGPATTRKAIGTDQRPNSVRRANGRCLYAFGETLPYEDNRVTLNHDKKTHGADQRSRSIVLFATTSRICIKTLQQQEKKCLKRWAIKM